MLRNIRRSNDEKPVEILAQGDARYHHHPCVLASFVYWVEQMISMYASNSKFAELDFLLTMRARLKNPAMFFDLKDLPPELFDKDIDDLELAIEMFFMTRPHNKE